MFIRKLNYIVIFITILFFCEASFACTSYARKDVYLGDYSTGTAAAAAMTLARKEFYTCSCGANYQNGKNYQVIKDCRFAMDGYPNYNYSKYVNLKVAALFKGCPVNTYKSPSGKCENFFDTTKYAAGETGGICGANPIDFSNGIKIQYETDYSVPSNSLFKYTRVYSSLDGKWIFPFQQKIVIMKAESPLLVDKPIVDASKKIIGYESYQIGNSPDEYISISRPNGSVYLFSRYSKKTETYKAPEGISGYVKKLASGWAYIDGVAIEKYNAEGQLVSIENPEGKLLVNYGDNSGVIVYSDSYGNTLTKTPLEGDNFRISNNADFEVTYQFVSGNLLTVSYSDGSSVSYHYENTQYPNLLTGITDENGKRYASWSYDSNKKARLSTHANNAERIDLVYNADNTVLATHISGKQTTYAFEKASGRNRIIKVTGIPTASCLAADSYYSYDSNGFRKTFTDKNGNVTETIRNARGLIEEERTGLQWVSGVNSTLVETANSQKTVTTWHDVLALPLTRTFYGWNDSAYQAYKNENTSYTSNNRIATFTVTDLTAISVPYLTSGRTHRWVYNYSYYDLEETQLQKQTVDGPRTDVNDITTYNYDALGNLASSVNALGHATIFSGYNSRGLVSGILDENGKETSITYTARGWLDTLTFNGTATNDYDYYANGLLKKVTLSDGSWLTYTYNDARHLIKVQNNLGESIEYTPSIIDGKWTQETVKDADANIVQQRSRIFDELGRLMTLQGQHGQEKQYRYDKNDNLKTENDALQQITSYQYDAQNRISETLDAEQNAKADAVDKRAIAFSYDIQGNLDSVTDQRGNTTSYLYDGFGDLIQQVSPDTGVTVFIYDANGNLTGKTDARGISVMNQYDALNRLVSVVYLGSPDENMTFGYDNTSNGNKGIGHLTAYSSNNLQTVLSYDAWGLAGSTDCVFTLLCYTTAYNRNLQGRLVSMVYPSGNILHYGYNSGGQVNSIKWQASGQNPAEAAVIANNIDYRPFSGNIKQLHYGNGVQSQFGYDTDGRLQYILATGNVGEIYNKGYLYTPVDNISHLNDNVQSTNNRSYHYDKNSRLTQDIKGNGDAAKMTSYVYDEVGNRQQKIQAIGEASPVSHETLTYAAESNRLLNNYDSVSGNHINYQYNAKGDITAVVANPNGSVNYDYNAVGRMQVSNALTGDITQYTLNAMGQRQIKMPNGDATLSTWYLYSLDGKILAEHNLETQQVQSEYVYLNGSPIAYVVTKNGSSAIYTVINDHLDTPQMLLDNNQNVVWKADYDAFGKISLPIEQVTFNLRFPGQYYDNETGLHYNYYRDYDPSLGRYVQSDPIGLGGGINTFGYVGGNPLGYMDFYGLEFITPLEGQKIVNEAKSWIGVPYFQNGGSKSTKLKADCSGATWKIYSNAGFPYNYSPAISFPLNPRFKPSPGNIPQVGDVGRWKGHILIFDPNAGGKNDSLSARRPGTPFGPAQSLWWGKDVTWYRYDKPEDCGCET